LTLHQEHSCLQEEMRQLEGKCEGLHEAGQEAMASHKMAALESEKLNVQLENLIEEKQACKANAKDSCLILEARHQELNSILLEESSALQESRSCLASLGQRNSILQREHVQLQEAIGHLECTCDGLHEAAQEAVTVRANNISLAEQLQDMEKALHCKEDQFIELEEKNRLVENECGGLTCRAAKVELQLAEYESEVASCQAEREHLLQTNDELSEACDDVANKMLGDQLGLLQAGADVLELQETSPEYVVALRRENVNLHEQNKHLLKAKQRTVALQEENRRLQDRIWRLGEIEQKSTALQAEVHKLHAENRLLTVARQKAKHGTTDKDAMVGVVGAVAPQ